MSPTTALPATRQPASRSFGATLSRDTGNTRHTIATPSLTFFASGLRSWTRQCSRLLHHKPGSDSSAANASDLNALRSIRASLTSLFLPTCRQVSMQFSNPFLPALRFKIFSIEVRSGCACVARTTLRRISMWKLVLTACDAQRSATMRLRIANLLLLR